MSKRDTDERFDVWRKSLDWLAILINDELGKVPLDEPESNIIRLNRSAKSVTGTTRATLLHCSQM